MMEVMTCVIFDAPFGKKKGHAVALFEEEFSALEIKEDLEECGFQVKVYPGKKSPRRFWYLKTTADFDSLVSILGIYFDAYLHLQVTPQGLVHVTESCGCATCREPMDFAFEGFVDAPHYEGEMPGGGPGTGFGFCEPNLN
jgi:hypothetical protein